MFDKKEYDRKYYIKNRDKNRENNRKRCKEWYLNNREKHDQYNKKNNPKYKERKNKRNRQYYEENKEKRLKQIADWSKSNPDKIKIIKSKCYKNNKIKLEYRINNNIRNAIWRFLKKNKNGKHWETLVGYNLNKLKKHLVKTMPEGYTWQDYMEGKLHIDHIIPASVFNFDCPEHIDFKRCWALSNLQLLPAKENIRKKNKLSKSFQPALKI